MEWLNWCNKKALSIGFGWVAVVITLGGLASLQSLCWTSGIAGTNSRKLLMTSDEVDDVYPVLNALFGSCGKTFRFQWWGWALQITYLAGLTCMARLQRTDVSGIHYIGATSTVLAMIFANDTLKSVDDASGVLYSRLTTTFIGFMLTALANFIIFVGLDCKHQTCCQSTQHTTLTQKGAELDGTTSEIVATA